MTGSTIDLHNSVSVNSCGGSQPSCPSTAKIEWGYPSVGQKVTGAGIATTGTTTVTGVWPARDVVFLSQATTAGETGATLTYTDNSFGFGNPISAVFQCTVNTSDVCLTVHSTQDLVSGASDIVVSGVNAALNTAWYNVTLGDGSNPALL